MRQLFVNNLLYVAKRYPYGPGEDCPQPYDDPLYFHSDVSGEGCPDPYDEGLRDQKGCGTGWLELSLTDNDVYDSCTETILHLKDEAANPWEQPFLTDAVHFARLLRLKAYARTDTWLASAGREFWSAWTDVSGLRAIYDFKTGDFDGDGEDDLLFEYYDFLFVMWSGRRPLLYQFRGDRGLNSYRLGDFDGDGTTDILFQENGEWRAYLGNGTRTLNSTSQKIGVSGVGVSSLRTGNFDGDANDTSGLENDDLLRFHNGRILVSFGYKSTPYPSASMGSWTDKGYVGSLDMSQMRFHDFNGDGVTDIFLDYNNYWYIKYGNPGTTAFGGWTYVNYSSRPLDTLHFGDFDGDGATDVFTLLSSGWNVSYGATTSWTVVNDLETNLDNLIFGDFNGDGKTDVLSDAHY